MSVTAGASGTIAMSVREKLRGKIVQTKVKRYWPGKAPEWADEPEDEPDLRTLKTLASLNSAFPSDDLPVGPSSDPRLRRLAQSRLSDPNELRENRRRIRQAEIIDDPDDVDGGDDVDKDADVDGDDDEDAAAERRRLIKERLIQRQRDEELPTVDEEDDVEEGDVAEEEEEESEYETDSEEEELNRRALAKPIFVPKAERETIAERERLEAEEAALEEKVRRVREERKVETKKIVVEKIREDREIQKNVKLAAGETGEVDTDDELNEEDYEGWKAREMARIKRDREDREAMVKEREEIERVRSMTEEERREWERKNPKVGAGSGGGSKQKWRFMQKYYHKGAFFQDDADDRFGTVGSDQIYGRDFSEPTGEDKLDKTILPKVMQVKHFGRSGRTKWTHLVNEDTTDWNNPWASHDSQMSKYSAKMAGMNRPIERPKGSKKLKDWEQR